MATLAKSKQDSDENPRFTTGKDALKTFEKNPPESQELSEPTEDPFEDDKDVFEEEVDVFENEVDEFEDAEYDYFAENTLSPELMHDKSHSSFIDTDIGIASLFPAWPIALIVTMAALYFILFTEDLLFPPVYTTINKFIEKFTNVDPVFDLYPPSNPIALLYWYARKAFV